MDIRVGQHWRTRSGTVVRVTKDRSEHAVVPRWRWSLSNGHIVDDSGNAHIEPLASHPSDLVQLLPDEKISQASVDAMDSTMGGLL